MRDGWLGLGIILGSAENFDELVLYWNLRAAGASVIFYDQTRGDRLRAFANAWIARQQTRGLGEERRFSMWLNRERPGDDSWRPDLNLEGLPLSLNDGRGEALWNGLNIEPQRPFFSAAYRDVVPSYSESDGKASVSFALPNRPFVEDDVRGGSQKFAVVIDAAQHSMDPDADLTFETPFVPELNEFYGRHFYHDYDAARSQLARLDDGAVALLTNLSTQRLAVSAFRVFDWMKAFFALDGIEIERSEPGLRCSRLIAQLGGLQACRVLKIRGAPCFENTASIKASHAVVRLRRSATSARAPARWDSTRSGSYISSTGNQGSYAGRGPPVPIDPPRVPDRPRTEMPELPTAELDASRRRQDDFDLYVLRPCV